jgi:hypothetical protein
MKVKFMFISLERMEPPMTRPHARLALGLFLALAAPLRADETSIETLSKAVADLSAEVARLKQEAANQDRLAELERRIDLLAAEIEKSRTGGAVEMEPKSGEPGFGPAASHVYRVAKGVSIGGYGEATYANPSAKRQDGEASLAQDSLDLLRAVVYTGYKFDDRTLFNSEIEFEHASTGEGDEERGEVSVEQAYLEFRPWRSAGFRAGMLVLPLGFLNELHEPPIFHGARRNEVESVVIPTTWHDVGAGAFGESGPFQWRGYLVAGLNSAGFTAQGIKEGRQQGSQSLAESLALAGRVDFTGAPGVLAGASLFTGPSGQGAEALGQRIGGRVTLFDLHVQYEHRGLQLRALYARSSIADVALINSQNRLLGDGESVGERQYGYYAQAAYDLLSGRGKGEWSATPFFRYERLSTQDRVPPGLTQDARNDRTVWTAGIGVKPILNVVLKADYQWRSDKAETGIDQFNLAIGYLF